MGVSSQLLEFFMAFKGVYKMIIKLPRLNIIKIDEFGPTLTFVSFMEI
jgi:hypothetical protein